MANFWNGYGGNPSPGNVNNYPSNSGPPPVGGDGFGSRPSPQVPFVGRYVTALTDILPNEVPMDGRAGIFPNADLREIFVKSWSADGSIKTFRYVLDTSVDLNAQVAPPPDTNYNQLAARIEELEKLVQKTSRQRGDNKSNQQKPEEVK